MAEITLTDEQYVAGGKLLDALRKLGWNIEGAFWAYLPGAEEWRLIFVTPQIDIDGDRAVLCKIRETISEFGADFAVSPFNVDVESPYDPVMTALGRMFSVVDSSGSQASGADVYGAYFDDLIFYHMDIRSPFEPRKGDAATRSAAQRGGGRSRRRAKADVE